MRDDGGDVDVQDADDDDHPLVRLLTSELGEVLEREVTNHDLSGASLNGSTMSSTDSSQLDMLNLCVVNLNLSSADAQQDEVVDENDSLETLISDISSLSSLGSFKPDAFNEVANPITPQLHYIRRYLRNALRGIFSAPPLTAKSSPLPSVNLFDF